ncbi:MAG: NAD-dependent epimerase/dehydratase family protein [Gammaproteobacteria bacterium]|nr:NAD-dependent epimerase/dehydratase family protein [Gammaproteobacteria bacterium]
MRFSGATVLVTGGTGSFGSTVVGRLLDSDVEKIIIFSRDEKKQDDMRSALQSDKVRFVIGDTRDSAGCDKVTRGVDFIFHAAALKQVPSCEFFPEEAVKTNIIGSANVIDAAIRNGVRKVVVLSTDKAVMPINAMGISKAMMEKIAIAKGLEARELRMGTAISVTRYGNVMSSRGSVIPRFIEAIKAGRALTITSLEMTRFMMTLQESVDLVLHAFRNSNGGELYVKRADAASIRTLVGALERFYGTAVRKSLIGPRHGEKFHETLATSEELGRSSDIDDFLEISPDSRGLNYESQGEQSVRKSTVDLSSDTVKQLTEEELILKFRDAGIEL